jgi:hypothetical protein
MSGRKFGDYLALQAPVLGLIGLAWALRLALSLAGLDGAARYASMTTLVLLGPLYYAFQLHRTAFGGYKQLYVLCLIQAVLAELLIGAGIAVGIFTGRDNIFTVPEYYPPSQGGTPMPVDGKTWTHALVHLLAGGFLFFPLVTWLLGALVLFVLRRVAPRP